MDLSAVLAGLAVAIALVGVAIALQRRPQVPAAVAGADVGAALEILRRSVEDTRVANAALMGELRGEVQRALGATEQSLVTQTTATQRTLTDLSRQLGTLGEQSVRIGDLAKDIGSLQDLLRAPKPRGGFGELMLERHLPDCQPPSTNWPTAQDHTRGPDQAHDVARRQNTLWRGRHRRRDRYGDAGSHR